MNSPSEDTLLMCPFCGGIPEYDETGDAEFTHFVSCTLCGASTDHYVMKEHAITAWNKREP